MIITLLLLCLWSKPTTYSLIFNVIRPLDIPLSEHISKPDTKSYPGQLLFQSKTKSTKKLPKIQSIKRNSLHKIGQSAQVLYFLKFVYCECKYLCISRSAHILISAQRYTLGNLNAAYLSIRAKCTTHIL